MFEEATAFNQNLSDWSPLANADMVQMFSFASEFEQDICDWFDSEPYPTTVDSTFFDGTKCASQGLSDWLDICHCVTQPLTDDNFMNAVQEKDGVQYAFELDTSDVSLKYGKQA